MKHENQTDSDQKRDLGESPEVEELDEEELERVSGGVGTPRGALGNKAASFGSRRMSSLDGKGNDVLTEE